MIRSPNGNESKYNSQPDLSRRTEEESNVSIRKRKKMDHDCDCKAEIQGLRSEVSRMNNLLENFVISQEKLMTDMRENIKTLNEEIKDIKSSTSRIVKDQDNIKGCITDLNSKFSTHEDRLTCLEGSLKTSTTTTIDSSEPNQLRKYEEIIQEIKERKKREKNIIIVGISEQTATSTEERVAKDEAEVLNITAVVTEVPKLTAHHVLPNLILKKHCTQVFSQSVGVGLACLAELGAIDKSSVETADLLLFFDDLFDSVNGSYSEIVGRKKYRAAVTSTSPHHNLWNYSIPILKSMKFFDPKCEKDDSVCLQFLKCFNES
ncbi:unnamed protein product [Parnassius apollo]|uniref:(apollo) hypothetical protein n=1 Tax=Parnassius apollo TaxID=110799 RepID=A0A8S3WDN0_PARAO|nr:unnamed protein product [Parnassius apollo]